MAGPSPGLHAALIRHTGYLLSRVGSFATREFADRLETLGLTPRMWGALNVLDAEGTITQHALGKSIGMDPSSMVSTIDELEARGLVERRRHPQDRRAHALYVTDEGRATLGRGRQLARQAQGHLLSPLDDDERAQLHDMLLRIAQAADAVDTSPGAVKGEPGPEPVRAPKP